MPGSGSSPPLPRRAPRKLEDFRPPLVVGSPLDAEYLALGGEARGGVMAAADGLRHGFGVRVWADGARYEGTWERDLQEGFGVYLGAGARGARYEGAWHEGRREGRGVESYGHDEGLPYTCPLGNQHDGAARCFYDGEWRQGYFWGEGTFSCCDGRQHVGAWRKGKRHGHGRWVMLPADLHYGAGGGGGGGGAALVANRGDEGEFGARVSRFSDLGRVRVFEGAFSKNKRTGQGKATLNNGDVMEGRFENGRADGLVRVTFGDSGKVSYARFVRGERKAWLKGRSSSGCCGATRRPRPRASRPSRRPRAATRSCCGSMSLARATATSARASARSSPRSPRRAAGRLGE